LSKWVLVVGVLEYGELSIFRGRVWREWFGMKRLWGVERLEMICESVGGFEGNVVFCFGLQSWFLLKIIVWKFSRLLSSHVRPLFENERSYLDGKGEKSKNFRRFRV
jgi:Na+-transporting NADH:ubiquinone oxidoreductase subunit NqrD